MDPNATTPPQRLSTYTPQSDTSKYIRTYAKDVARITNTPAPEPEPREKTGIESPEDQAREAAALGVGLPEFDASPVNHKDGASPKEFKQEVVQLSEEDSKDIFQGPQAAPSPASTPLMPQGSIGIVEPVAPIPVAPSAPDADREAVLARLRAKVAAPQPETAPMPSPTPEGSVAPAPLEPVPLRTAAPDFTAFTATIPQPPAPVPQAPAAPVQATPSPIHTFSSDFANQIDTQKGTAFSVLAAQSDAGQTPKSAKGKRSLLPLFAGIAMLMIGIGAVAGAYLFVEKGTNVPTLATVPSLITFDESIELQGTGAVLMQALADVAQEGGVGGNVIVTYVTNTPDETTATSIPQPGGVFIRQLNLPAPDILLRNIQDTSTVGVITAGSESRPFFLFKVNSYERTFAGMLAWERNIADDLAVLYPMYPSISFETGSTTASTTVPALPPTVSTETFADDVVANYDVRILRDSNGKSLMLYGYLGKDILVIARDEAAFTALTTRLRASGN